MGKVTMMLVLVAFVWGCACEDAPPTWRSAPLNGCSEAGDTTCCSYANFAASSGCSYTICATGCAAWDQTSSYCW